MTFLDKILDAKRADLVRAKSLVPQSTLERLAEAPRVTRGFRAALDKPGVRVIAEIKRASPSRGDIRADLDPAATARAYAAGGAAALSVLTEPTYFKGSPEDLRQARAAVGIPVLRKDFIIDPYQVYETAAMGADAMLLIVRILDDQTLSALYGLAHSLGLDVLTEIFDERDAARANALGATLIGINNRDLAHFKTDVSHASRLATHLRAGTSIVALSGIHSDEDIRQTLSGGIRRFLIGEALVRQPDPTATLRGWTAQGAATEARSDTGNANLANLKICGITTRETARFCADHGVGALGAVFFPKSPRHVSPEHARRMFEGLPDRVARVGVFVDTPSEELIAAARTAGLDTVQLHGNESLDTVTAAQKAGFRVIKVVKITGTALVETAQSLPLSAGILVECGLGTLPGGNGAAWQWADAAPLAGLRPFALAGGLTPQNLEQAAALSGASAWDLSSGVETAPGIKDHEAILKLTDNLRRWCPSHQPSFWKP